MMQFDSSIFTRNTPPIEFTSQQEPCHIAVTKKTPGTRCALPLEFQPEPYSVIIGRGKKIQESVGNLRLKVLASTFLARYSGAHTKIEKTQVVSDIVRTIRSACPIGSFIKFTNGQWWEVDDPTAREKVGYALRDLLSDKYRSSSKSKVARRKEQVKQEKEMNATTDEDGFSSSFDADEHVTSSSRIKNTDKVVSKRLQQNIPLEALHKISDERKIPKMPESPIATKRNARNSSVTWKAICGQQGHWKLPDTSSGRVDLRIFNDRGPETFPLDRMNFALEDFSDVSEEEVMDIFQ
jgi:hypothetical protein